MKKTFGLASAVLLAVSVTACSSSSDSSSGDYCDTLKSTQTEFGTMDFTSLDDTEFTALRDKISALADQAPSDVSDDWDVIGSKLDDFKGILDDAGINFDDIASLQANQIPDGVDPAKLQAMTTQIQELVSDNKLSDAQKAISDNAKADCDITLDGTPAS